MKNKQLRIEEFVDKVCAIADSMNIDSYELSLSIGHLITLLVTTRVKEELNEFINITGHKN